MFEPPLRKEATSAIYDPSCRIKRRTHKEVAYRGYGVYRGETKKCVLKEEWNAWLCTADVLKPSRLIIESMDRDHNSRPLTPVAVASGGYVDLMNGGWGHGSRKKCGGYICMNRLSTFYSTIAVNRSYDIAFSTRFSNRTPLLSQHFKPDRRRLCPKSSTGAFCSTLTRWE